MSNIKFPFWEGVRKLLVDRGDNTYAERVEAYPPAVLMTDGDGPYARVRVDVGQTGFFAGREFRTFHEFSIPSGQSIVIRAITPIDVFVQQFSVDLWTAELRIEWYAGGTSSGTYGTQLPIMRTNQTSTIDNTYTSQVTMDAGGSFSGGQVVDILQLYAVQNPAKGSATEGGESDPIGMPAGTYHIKLTNINSVTATGLFKARWEERP